MFYNSNCFGNRHTMKISTLLSIVIIFVWSCSSPTKKTEEKKESFKVTDAKSQKIEVYDNMELVLPNYFVFLRKHTFSSRPPQDEYLFVSQKSSNDTLKLIEFLDPYLNYNILKDNTKQSCIEIYDKYKERNPSVVLEDTLLYKYDNNKRDGFLFSYRDSINQPVKYSFFFENGINWCYMNITLSDDNPNHKMYIKDLKECMPQIRILTEF